MMRHFVLAAAMRGAWDATTSVPPEPILPSAPAAGFHTGLLVSWCLRQLPIAVGAGWREPFAEAVHVASELVMGADICRGLVLDARATTEQMTEHLAAAEAVRAALDGDYARCVYWAARSVADPHRFVVGLQEFYRLRAYTPLRVALAA